MATVLGDQPHAKTKHPRPVMVPARTRFFLGRLTAISCPAPRAANCRSDTAPVWDYQHRHFRGPEASPKSVPSDCPGLSHRLGRGLLRHAAISWIAASVYSVSGDNAASPCAGRRVCGARPGAWGACQMQERHATGRRVGRRSDAGGRDHPDNERPWSVGKTVRSARKALGVKTERIGFGPGSQSMWSLPKAA